MWGLISPLIFFSNINLHLYQHGNVLVKEGTKMILEKLINVNEMFDTIIGGTLSEWDLKSAGATAIREIKGESIYNNLINLEKENRNIKIGLMMRDEPGLSDKVNSLMLKYLNMFISENKIKYSNIITTTRDSIILYNKIPMKTNFGFVEFRNKDGFFSSMYRIKRLTIYFDSMRNELICKGVSNDVVNNSSFLNDYLKDFLRMIEGCQKSGDEKIFNILTKMRTNYLNWDDNSIYRDVLNENRIGVKYNDEIIYMENNFETGDDSFQIIKESNFVNIVLPIMRSVLING